MIISKRYETRMTPTEINSWIQEKADEKIGFILKVRKYVTRANEQGFMIRERRLNKYQNFKPRIIGKFSTTISNTKVDIKVIASFSGILFFSVFLIGFPIAILYNYFENGSESITSDLTDKLLFVVAILVIGVPIMFWTLIRPMYYAKDWIEKELKLNKTE